MVCRDIHTQTQTETLINRTSIENNPNYLTNSPLLSSSKQAKAFLMTSSGSVPMSFSQNIVRNMVKFMGPGASHIIASNSISVGALP